MALVFQVRDPVEPGLGGVQPVDAERRAARPREFVHPAGARHFFVVGEAFHAGLWMGELLISRFLFCGWVRFAYITLERLALVDRKEKNDILAGVVCFNQLAHVLELSRPGSLQTVSILSHFELKRKLTSCCESSTYPYEMLLIRKNLVSEARTSVRASKPTPAKRTFKTQVQTSIVPANLMAGPWRVVMGCTTAAHPTTRGEPKASATAATTAPIRAWRMMILVVSVSLTGIITTILEIHIGTGT